MSAGLSVLPPSPPTTTSRKHASLTQDIEYSRTLGNIKGIHSLKDAPLGTPDESPASFPGSGSGSGKSRKRVEFSPWTNIHNAPVFTTSSPNVVAVRPLLPSRELSSSASILKTSSQLDLTPQAFEDDTRPQVSLVDMLESITQQLSRNGVAESIDAYQTLSSTLKAYSEVPDSQAFKSKLGPLMQHVRRDLVALDKSENGPAEITLATETLKVLAILAWNRNFSILLSNEIQGYILDRAIHVLEEHKAPKGVILHYLHLLATQDFRHSIVASNGRVGRLLDALKDLTQHIKGNGTVSGRLTVYQRLLEQARSQMKAKPLSWIHELLDGLTCPHKETRTRAIEVGTKAVAVYPSSSTISHALRTVLDMWLEDGKTVGIFACRRLERMLANKDDGLIVPQIWAIVLSLMKGIEGGIDKWSSLKEWLKVMQRCFNSSNSAIRSQANIAWNRFVYVVSPSEVNESLLGMLIKPIAVQMERKGMEREDRSSRATAFSAYCNLLYYSFRPSASHKQYDRAWDEYVVKVMTPSFLEKSPAAADRACRILMALFWNDNSKSKLWREIRAQENVLMEPEELPTIDYKWIRSKSSSILKIFKILFQNSSWGSEDRPEQSFVATGWKHFSKALGAACRKEMKPSVETMQALTNTLAFLSDTWKTGPSALNSLEETVKDAFMIRFRFMCMSVLTEIGAIPLIEGSMSAELVEAYRRTGASRESAPIIQFLSVLSSISESVIPNQAYCEFIKEILLLPRKARIPTRLRIRLFHQSAVSVLVANSQSSTDAAGAYIWQAIASAVQEEFDSSDTPVNLEPEMDNVLEDVVKILEIGVAYSPSSITIWCSLLNSIVRFAAQGEPQNVANISTIANSLSSCIEKHESPRLMMEIAELIQRVVPFIELSVARISPRHPRGKLRTKATVVMSPLFNKLLFLLNFQLEQAYTTLSSEGLRGVSSTIDAICQCLRSCPSDVLIYCLKTLESSLSLWLQDKQRLLTSATPVGAVKLTAGRKMCSLLIDIFGKMSEHGDGLEQLGSLLAAGFRSTHKLTVNQMIEMWNSTFGTKKPLSYPAALKAALERLQPFVDLELPSIGFDANDMDMADAPTFVDSQDEDAQGRSGSIESINGKPKRVRTPSLLSPSPWEENKAFSSPSLAPQAPQTAREHMLVAATSKPKPRHDDSQVQYVAIESSPLQNVDNESQYLTDKQKEVRARRQAEPAVVFPDLRSSPLPRNGLLGPPRIKNLSLDLKQAEGFEDNGPATPTLPMLPNEDRDEEMASSPTPQSKQPVLRLDDIELPSSPPSMPGCAGLEAPAELICSHVGALQNAGSNDQTDDRLFPPESYHGNDDPQDRVGGGAPPVAEQQLQLDASEIDRESATEGREDVEVEEQLPEQASLLDAPGRSADPTLPFESLVASGGPEMIVVDTIGEDRDQVDTKNVAGDIVMESIEGSHNEQMKQPVMPLEKEMRSEYLYQSSVHEEDNASTRDETKTESRCSKGKIQQDLEMAGMLPTRQSDASEAEPGKQTGEDLVFQVSLSNSSAPNVRFTQVMEVDHPAILSNFIVITRNSPAASYDSHADSDEVDMLSASQLSQDLDWHVALEEGLSQTERSPEVEIKPATRKRKRSVGYFASPKKRKDVGSPTDRGHPLLTQPSGTPGQAKKTEEIFDCIVLDTTPQPLKAANQSSRLSPDAVNTQAGGRKRGRKRKQLGNTLPGQSLSVADSGSSSRPEVVVKVEAMPMKEESPSAEEAAIVFSRPREISSPRTAPTIVREGEGDSTLTEGAMIGSRQPLEIHIMADNSPVAVLIQSPAAASEVVMDSPVEPSSVPNTLQTKHAIHAHTPLDVQGAESGPDMVDRAASAPTQHNRLPPESDRLWQSRRTPANTPLGVGVPKDSSGAIASAPEAAAEAGIIGSLQQVLKCLKSASMGRSTLREIDDLLFEIRIEAQHAIGRQMAGQ